jgi:hypothetical protein
MTLSPRQCFALYVARQAWPIAVNRYGACAEESIFHTVRVSLDHYDWWRKRHPIDGEKLIRELKRRRV